MSEKKTTHFRMEEDGEGNLSLDIQGTGGSLAQMLASAMDDDPEIHKLFEFAFLMVKMKNAGIGDVEDDDIRVSETGPGFMNNPTAKA